MPHQVNLSCRCGSTEWRVNNADHGWQIKCYCVDCQSFVRHLQQDDAYLEGAGTQLYQTTPDNVTFTKGIENVALLRQSPKGLFRWYTKCCNTPVANTLTTPGLPFCGLALPKGHDGFGPVRAHMNVGAANPPRKAENALPAVVRLLLRALRAKVTGKGRNSPFFNADGTPRVEPSVLTLEQRNAAREGL